MDHTTEIMNTVVSPQREQRALGHLLEEFQKQANHHFVLHVRTGDVSSYLASVTLEWVASKVGFATDLPILHEADKGLDQLRKYRPEWSRQLRITHLATRRHHRLPPLLLAGDQRWIHEKRHERWGVDAHAMNHSLTLRGLEPTGSYWDLDDTGTRFYALDGQHRLMGILGLRDLVQTGRLHAFNDERNPIEGIELSREEIVNNVHEDTGESHADIHERLQRIMNERIGVEIVPAVCIGETYEEALQRLRQTLVDTHRKQS